MKKLLIRARKKPNKNAVEFFGFVKGADPFVCNQVA